MDLGLQGKVALVTGGNRGIGKAVARQLALEGVDVAIAARDMTVAHAAADEIASASGRRVVAFPTDTSDDAAVRSLVQAVHERFGRIDILVNCAAQPGGQSRPPGLAEVTVDAFWADMNTKVMGYLRCAREVAPFMKAQGWGRIINISGLMARSTGNVIGSMRNVSVAALSKNLGDELGPFGINVTCVHPGLTRTERTPGVIARQAAAQGVPEAEIEQRMASQNAVGKLITSEDIANIVAFLASPRSIAINGDSIAAGGGRKGTIHY